MSALLRAIAPDPHTISPNVYIQIANKMGFKNIVRDLTILTSFCLRDIMAS
jgi:hypothetical protein